MADKESARKVYVCKCRSIGGMKCMLVAVGPAVYTSVPIMGTATDRRFFQFRNTEKLDRPCKCYEEYLCRSGRWFEVKDEEENAGL